METIKINSISKKFKDHLVLDELNFSLNKGESVSIIGRNGAGKTVLSKIILGLLKADNGVVKINTENGVFDIGVQFQDINLPSELKVTTMLKIYEKEFKNKELINELSNVFEIEEFKNRRISKLSGGQKQRINLLLSLVKEPTVLILDEFITGLDVLSAEKIIKYLEKLISKKKIQLIIITHQPEEIKRLTDRVVKLEDGKISKEYKTTDIDKKYKGDFKKFLMEEIHE